MIAQLTYKSKTANISLLLLILPFLFIFSCGGDDDAIPPPPPAVSQSFTISTPAVSTVTDSAIISWTSSVATIHLVEYGTISGVYTFSTLVTATPSTLHIENLDGLQRNQTYYYRVVNFTGGYPSVISDEYSFTTTSPIQISNLSSAVTTTTAAINWNSNVGTLHQLEYGTIAGTYIYAIPFSATEATAHSVLLSGLNPNTTYYYKVTNIYSDFSDGVSTESSFTTSPETSPTLTQKMRSLWIVGGLSGGTIGTTISQVDIYDPILDIWYPAVTNLPTPVSFAAVASVQGKIYVIGGYDVNGNVSVTNQEYDIATNTWTYKSIVNFQPRANVTAAVVGTQIFVLGGTTAAYNAAFTASTNTQSYNTITANWTLGLTAFGAAGADRISISYDEVVSNFGGRTTGLATGLSTTHDGYSVFANSLTTGTTEVALTGTARAGMAYGVYDSGNGTTRMFIAGGITTFAGTSTCHLFNGITSYTSTNQFLYLEHPFAAPATWQTGPALPSNSSYGAGVVNNGKYYVCGGTSAFPPSARSTLYEIDAGDLGAWVSRSTMPIGRYGHRVVVIDQ